MHYISAITRTCWPARLFSCLLGALLVLAFAPFHYYLLALVIPALFFTLINTQVPSEAVWRGWFFGLGQFGVGVSWVYVSIHTYGNTPVWLAALITFLFVALMALYPALLAYIIARFCPKHSWITALGIYPIAWVLCEWLRSGLLSGFPWLLLGYSQVPSPLAGFAPLIGVYGLSWLSVFISSLLLVIASKQRQRIHFGIAIVLIVFAGHFLSTIEWTHMQPKGLNVSLVQGNIPQEIKWQAHHLDTILNTYATLSAPLWQSSDMVIWPESAIPLSLQEAVPYVQTMRTLAETNNSHFITGIPVDRGDGHYYNAIIAKGSRDHGVYYKYHLVPFGEYLPLERWLRGLIGLFNIPQSNFVSGTQAPALLYSAGLRIGSAICYEIAYPSWVLKSLPKADALLTISNDTWFGHSLGPKQHLQIAQMRALETGRYVMRATNNGITAIINPHGVLQARANAFVKTVLTSRIWPYHGATPLVYYGHHFIIVLLWVGLVVCFFAARKKQAMEQ